MSRKMNAEEQAAYEDYLERISMPTCPVKITLEEAEQLIAERRRYREEIQQELRRRKMESGDSAESPHR